MNIVSVIAVCDFLFTVPMEENVTEDIRTFVVCVCGKIIFFSGNIFVLRISLLSFSKDT